MKPKEEEIGKNTALIVKDWIKEQCRWKYWRRNTFFVFLVVDLIFMIGTYRIYFGVAKTLGSTEPMIYAYCAFAELIASIGLAFFLFSGNKDAGMFITLSSVPWLMFFGFAAALAPFIINNFQVDIIAGIPAFIYHAFMFAEGIIILLIIQTEDIIFPVALGTAGLCLYILSSKDFLTVMLNYFFKL